MSDKPNSSVSKHGLMFTPEQERIIDLNIQQTLLDLTYKFIKTGVIVQFAIGTILFILLFKQLNITTLSIWYCTLIFFDITSFNLQTLYERRKSNVAQYEFWHLILLIALTIDVAIWGSVGFLLMPENIIYQFIIICFLFIASAGFTQGNITDRIASAVSIVLLLAPLAVWCFTQGKTLYSGLGASIIFYAAFLFYVAKIGHDSQRASIRLRFINEALSDILDQKVKDRTLELENTLELVTHQATHDLLTDLPNQRLLQRYLQDAIDNAKHTQNAFAVAFLGLNRTKIISDSLGHQTGSGIIKAFADRLKALQEQSNSASSFTRYTVTHAWGDVFVIVLSPLHTEDTTSIIRNLFAVLQEPFYFAEKSFSLTASIGVCLYPKDGTDSKALLMNAEAAMFRAKKYGGNKFEFYTADLNAHTNKQLELESGLHTALAQNEFIVHYQPIVDIKTHEIVGMEALTRWQHPTLGLISPVDFIPLAEEIGLIVPLGEWVLRKACLQTKQWHNSGFANLKVSVNLAAKQLAQETILTTISNVLKETDLPAHALELEFTETAILDEKIIPIAKKLKEMGIHLAIDDFGTGYSGLTYVRQFSIDRLKIDKSFVQDIGQNKESETIILTIIEMAKKLEMQTLAEGVETEEQLQFLKDHGCELIQGYYFSRPVGSEAFTSLLYKKDSVQSDRFKYLN